MAKQRHYERTLIIALIIADVMKNQETKWEKWVIQMMQVNLESDGQVEIRTAIKSILGTTADANLM